jgi:hypothetical protein
VGPGGQREKGKWGAAEGGRGQLGRASWAEGERKRERENGPAREGKGNGLRE